MVNSYILIFKELYFRFVSLYGVQKITSVSPLLAILLSKKTILPFPFNAFVHFLQELEKSMKMFKLIL